jgi:carbonic anhydrase
MERRTFLKGIGFLSVCPLCSSLGVAEEGHWSYSGEVGPERWGVLSTSNIACGAGSQQSPLDLAGATGANLSTLELSWHNRRAEIIDNGHTIQINVPSGSMLTTGAISYELLQFHFHSPSEHLVQGRRFAMEVHFVHQRNGGDGLGVIGVFLDRGKSNPVFAKIAAGFPTTAKGKARIIDGADPNGLLPKSLKYWKYEGSLTTPPCSEVVDWMIMTDPIQAAAADIDKFTALYPMNARPIQGSNRRFVLRSN